jgi:pimeloyl-ACP methyl ester carboxylesterase
VASTDPIKDGSILLPGGRRLAYAEWGDLEGFLVFYFHGMPHSRLFFPDPAAAEEMGVWAITVDRPGMGRSDPQVGHFVSDWPVDVAALADALGQPRFGVIGWSAGVSYALACAALMAERVGGVAVTTSNAALAYLIHDDPEFREMYVDEEDRRILELLPFGLEVAAQEVATSAADWVAGMADRPEQLLEGMAEADREVLANDDLRASFLAAVKEAVRQGADAMAPQWVAQLAPWGFRLEDIPIPVHVYAGAQDGTTPPRLMKRLARRIPEHRFHIWEDAGHLGIATHMREVLAQVTRYEEPAAEAPTVEERATTAPERPFPTRPTPA